MPWRPMPFETGMKYQMPRSVSHFLTASLTLPSGVMAITQ
jgi:hypothetical protein